MKRWAVLVVALYFLILVVLTAPLILVAFYPLSSAHDAFSPFSNWMYWAGLGVMVLAQGVMLLVPVDLARGRPVAQRPVFWTILASGLMVGLLGFGAAISIDEFIRKGNADPFHPPFPWVVLALLWVIWTIVFHRTGRSADAMDRVTRQCRYLLKGSILELLIAVPTHIVARARDYCCAGVMTFFGIVFGVAVMLISFGPGVFFLFVARWKRLHPQRTRAVD